MTVKQGKAAILNGKAPDNLQVSGGLYLGGCTGLTALPDNLQVSGDLDLGGCTGLTALPDNLQVSGDLSLSGCTGLTAKQISAAKKKYKMNNPQDFINPDEG